MAAILSDISDDTNFIYILSANECQQRNNEEHFETNKTAKRNHNLFTNKLLGHVTKTAESKFFFWSQKNESALAGTSRLVEVVPENQDRSKSAP